MGNIRSVIFDLDGTLLNTLEDLCDSCNEALRLNGYEERTIDEVRQFVGNGLSVLMQKALPNGKSNADYDKALKTLRECYAKNWQNKTSPYDGVQAMLKTLCSMGIKLGIVSNKPDEQVKELSSLYFSGVISLDYVIGEMESKGIRKKPAPDSVLTVLRAMKEDVSSSVYVGDSEVDIATAKACAMPCISVSWGFRSKDALKDAGAAVIVDSPKELLACIN